MTNKMQQNKLLKLLTHDGDTRLFVVDAAEALQSSNLDGIQTETARQLYKEIFTNCCLLRGLLTEDQRLSVTIQFKIDDHWARCEIDGAGQVHCVFSPVLKAFTGNRDQLVGEGATLSVTRGSSRGGMFSGVVELMHSSADEFFSHFFTQSDQTETVLMTWIDGRHARGSLVQRLPGLDTQSIERLLDQLRQVEPTLRTIPWDEVEGVLTPYAHVVERLTVRSECHCSKEMFLGMLMTIDTQDLIQLLGQNESQTIECGLCGTKYIFEPSDIRTIVDLKLGNLGT